MITSGKGQSYNVFGSRLPAIDSPCQEHSTLSLRLSLGIPALFGLAGKGKGCAGYDLMSLRKRRADREAAEASS